MSTRLQVVVDDRELGEIREVAEAQGMTVSEWVRQTLRRARQQHPTGDVEHKLGVVRAAVRHSYPTADIDQMLAESEQGFLGRLP